ncbi:hypothetical protein Tco_0701953 [Tanacetum coccineum]|uniref:CCT domain-containing protein n=1 Tax=Tanacetum coccineum TaxID=301880 RepID=A0ABQ4XVV6_9ASTR
MTWNLSYTMNLNTSVKSKEKPFKEIRRKAVVQEVRGRYNCKLQKNRHFRETIRKEMRSGNEKEFIKVDEIVDDTHDNDLVLNVDHINEADECEMHSTSDVTRVPLTQTIYMPISHAEYPNYDEAGPS